jgi:hypothetical protein
MLPGAAPAVPVPYAAPVSSVTPGLDAAGTAPAAGIGMPAWLIVAALTLLILMTAAGVVLVLRQHDHHPAAEDVLSILDSPDPPAGVTVG